MARIAGVDIPNEKRIEISLRYIFGIGPKSASDHLREGGYGRRRPRRAT